MNHKSTSRRRFLMHSALLGPVLFGAAACGRGSHPAGGHASGDSIGEVVYKVDTRDPVAFLTIDDGVIRDPEMAEILRAHGLSATLFLTDQYVEQDVDFFRDLSDRTGSPIENHTLDHPDLTTESFDEQRRQIGDTSDRYEALFGMRPKLMRPPYGSFNDETLRAAAACGVKHVVHWTAVIDRGAIQFAAGDHLTSGDIVLMHFTDDFGADVERFVEQANRSDLRPALLKDYLR